MMLELVYVQELLAKNKRTDSTSIFWEMTWPTPRDDGQIGQGFFNGPLESDLPHIHLDILRLRDSSKCWGFVRSDGGPF